MDWIAPNLLEKTGDKEKNLIEVEVYSSPSCPHCPQAVEMVKKIASEFGERIKWLEIDITSWVGFHKILDYGILHVPTIVINGDPAFIGVPDENNLRDTISEKLQNQRN
jgi:small redox-active disulfide protein 1